MTRILLFLCLLCASSLNFASDEMIAGEVSPSKSQIPLKTPDDADDVIIMEEDSDYQENEEEDSDTDSAEAQYKG